MDNMFIILTATFIITMVIWFLYTVFFSLSENEKRKRKKKVKYVDRETIKKEKVVKETEVKEYTVKDMRKEKNIEKVSIVDEEVVKEEQQDESYEYGNYMYDVLVERSEENNKVYHTKNIEENEKQNYYDEPEILDNTYVTNSENNQRRYGQVKEVDYVKVVNKLKELENQQNDKDESLASEFKGLSKEMKIYIIDNIIGNL